MTINLEAPPARAGRVGQLLPTEVPIVEGAGSATSEGDTRHKLQNHPKTANMSNLVERNLFCRSNKSSFQHNCLFLPFLVLTVKTGSISLSEA